MTLGELERAAQELYERNAPVAPRWDQLGEVTKQTWREDAEKRRDEDAALDSMLA